MSGRMPPASLLEAQPVKWPVSADHRPDRLSSPVPLQQQLDRDPDVIGDTMVEQQLRVSAAAAAAAVAVAVSMDPSVFLSLDHGDNVSDHVRAEIASRSSLETSRASLGSTGRTVGSSSLDEESEGYLDDAADDGVVDDCAAAGGRLRPRTTGSGRLSDDEHDLSTVMSPDSSLAASDGPDDAGFTLAGLRALHKSSTLKLSVERKLRPDHRRALAELEEAGGAGGNASEGLISKVADADEADTGDAVQQDNGGGLPIDLGYVGYKHSSDLGYAASLSARAGLAAPYVSSINTKFTSRSMREHLIAGSALASTSAEQTMAYTDDLLTDLVEDRSADEAQDSLYDRELLASRVLPDSAGYVKQLGRTEAASTTSKDSAIGGTTLTERQRVRVSRADVFVPTPSQGLYDAGERESPGSLVASDDVNWSKQFFKRIARLRSSQPVPSYTDYSKLCDVAHNFLEVAQMYGRVIIREKELPDELKTIKPLGFSQRLDGQGMHTGRAGGLKYKLHNVFFKFAVDSSGLYGDHDKYVQKAAGHELKGLMSIYQVSQQWLGGAILTPLMALIDYHGHRLIAISVLPIDPMRNSTTLVYGSHDGGLTVRASDRVANDLMCDVGDHLNLKEHLAGLRAGAQQRIIGPTDLELHRVRISVKDQCQRTELQDRFVACDFARLFPPAAPDVCSEILGTAQKKGCFLFELLRPELVLRFPKPLCSDAFCGMSERDPHRAEHENDIRDATRYLLETVIPDFAFLLGRVFSGGPRSRVAQITDLSRWFSGDSPTAGAASIESGTSKMDFYRIDDSLESQVRHLASLVHVAHREGINCRYLGRVRFWASDDLLRQLLLTECVARVAKNEIQRRTRELLSGRQSGLRRLYLTEFLSVLNLLLRSEKSGSTADMFWSTDVKSYLAESFPQCLTAQELQPGHALYDNISPFVLVMRLQQLMGFELAPSVLRDLKSLHAGARFDFVSVDVLSLPERTKHMNIVASAEATALFLESLNSARQSRLFDLSMQRYASAVALKPDDTLTLSAWAEALYSYYERCGNELFFHQAVLRFAQGSNASRLLHLALHYHDLADKVIHEEQLFRGITQRRNRSKKEDVVGQSYRNLGAASDKDQQFRKYSTHAEILYESVLGTRVSPFMYDAHLGLGRLLYARAMRASQLAKDARSEPRKFNRLASLQQRLGSESQIDASELHRVVNVSLARAGGEFRRAVLLKPEMHAGELMQAVQMPQADDSRQGDDGFMNDSQLCNAVALCMWNERRKPRRPPGETSTHMAAHEQQNTFVIHHFDPRYAGVRWSTAGVVNILRLSVTLKRLDLSSFSDFEDDNLMTIAQATPSVSHAVLRNCHLLRAHALCAAFSNYWKKLVLVDLRGVFQADDDCCRALSCCRRLRVVRVDCRRLSDDGVKLLVTGNGRRRRPLVKLGLQRAFTLSRSFFAWLADHAAGMEHFHISWQTSIDERDVAFFIRSVPSLKTLSVRFCTNLRSSQELAEKLSGKVQYSNGDIWSRPAVTHLLEIQVTGTKLLPLSALSASELLIGGIQRPAQDGDAVQVGSTAHRGTRHQPALRLWVRDALAHKDSVAEADLEQQFCARHGLKYEKVGFDSVHSALRLTVSAAGLPYLAAIAAAKVLALSRSIRELHLLGPQSRADVAEDSRSDLVDSLCWRAVCSGIAASSESLVGILASNNPCLSSDHILELARAIPRDVQFLAVMGLEQRSTTTEIRNDDPFAALSALFSGTHLDLRTSVPRRPAALCLALAQRLSSQTPELRALRFLSLDHVFIGDEGFKIVCDALADPSFPCVRDSPLPFEIDRCETGFLRKIREGLRTAGGMEQAAAFSEGRAMLMLSLSGCGITDATPLCAAIARNAAVSAISLSSNSIFNADGSLAPELGRSLCSNTSLRALDLDRTGLTDVALIAMLKCSSPESRAPLEGGLRELSLAGNDVAKLGVIELSNALLSESCTLDILNLEHNPLLVAAVESLTVALPMSKLKELRLSGPGDSADSESKLVLLLIEAMSTKCTVQLDPPALHSRIHGLAKVRFPTHLRELAQQRREEKNDMAVRRTNAVTTTAMFWGEQIQSNKLARFLLRKDADGTGN